MSEKWYFLPKTKGGKSASIVIGIVLVVWMSLPVLVQIMNRSDFDRFFGLTFVVILLASSLAGIVAGWIAFTKENRSILLLIATCLMSAVLLLALIGEVIEALIIQ